MDVAVHRTSFPAVVFAERDVDPDRAAALLGEDVAVHAAEDVAGAVEVVESVETVDAVVTAATLADGTGTDLARAVRDRDPDVPVLYLAAEPDVDDAVAATAAGASVYLPPSRVEDGGLRARLDEVVDGHDRRRQLRREREMFRALMEAAPLSIYFKDAEGRHVAASSHVDPHTGESVLGRTDQDLYGDIGDGPVQPYLDDLAVVETGEPILDGEEHHVTAGGDETWLRTTKRPWRDETGAIQGLVGVTRNVSETVERERDRERQKRRLDRFARFASHELRAPVSEARELVERARGGDDDAADPGALVAAQRAIERMDDRIEHLLTMATSGADGSDAEWVPLADAVGRTWSGLQTGSASLEVALDDVEIRADVGQLHHLLEDVFRNATGSGLDASSGRPGSSGDHPGDDHPGEGHPGEDHRVDDHPDERDRAHGGVVSVGRGDRGFYVESASWGIDATEAVDDESGSIAGREVETAAGDVSAGTGATDATTAGDADAGASPGWNPLTIATEVAAAHGWRVDATDRDDGATRIEFAGSFLRTAAERDAVAGDPVELAHSGDVGDASPPGEAVAGASGPDGETWTVRGGGHNVWGQICEFHGAWAEVAGDVRVEARVTGVEHVHEFSKAGVALFDPEDDAAPVAYVGASPVHGVETLWRAEHGDPIETATDPELDGRPLRVRIERVGDRVTHYAAVEGGDWTVVDQRPFHGRETVAAGLAVCSHADSRRCEATFEDVRVVPLDAGGVAA